MKPGIKIALLWHMHQPFYENPYNSKKELPWVRLHGLKDYYGMAAILNDFPQIKATYNLVPSLLTQLESYTRGDRDIFQELFLKDAHSLKIEEIHFIVRHFFTANTQNMIKPWPGYRTLYDKKIKHKESGHTPWEKIFSVDEIRDLQVWFQLCYFDEEYKQHNPHINRLLKKGNHFTETDKTEIANTELELLKKIIPLYRKLSETGQIEISTTPFYHPILPLLINPQEGRISNPHLPCYDLSFNWKEDAVFQLQSALDYMQDLFGNKPPGIWPSEGGLSMDVLEIMEEMGIRWTATDEINLSRSLGIPIDRDERFDVKNPGALYKPYVVKGKNLRIFFRDHHLSDLIGFHYQKIPYDKAANDLVERIKRIPVPKDRSIVVPIILDGENAWEYYPNSGRDFLKNFFQAIIDDENIETVTFSEATAIEPGVIDRLCSGSWIDGNFNIWIGDEEDRKGWKLIEKTKAAIEESKTGLSEEQKKEIRQYISIAEGSDWFWWFGKENYTSDLDIFDNLFRKNLQKVFEILGKEIPGEFYTPVSGVGGRGEGLVMLPPSQRIDPRIDGIVGSYLEWLHAGCIDAGSFGGAMNISNPIVKTLYFGFSSTRFYLRIDTENNALHYFENEYTLDIIIKCDKTLKRLHIQPLNNFNNTDTDIETAIENIIEIGVALESLNLCESDSIYLQLEWKYKGDYFMTLPFQGYFSLKVPTERDYSASWLV